MPRTGSAREVTLAGAAVVLLVLSLVLVVPRLLSTAADEVPAAAPSSSQSWQSWQPPAPSRTARPTRDPATGPPMALDVPAVGLDARVVPIDIGAGRVLTPPADPTVVGWWAAGAEPGAAEGTVVLAGHTVRAGGGVFDDLADLDPGAVVEVRTARGVITYLVEAVEEYSREELANDATAVFSQSVGGRLVLVTCADYADGDYAGNLVVTALPHRRLEQG